jgi:hypothetical protein
MSARSRLTRVVALLVLTLFAASCASIPESSDPKVVKRVDEGNPSTPVPAPPRDIDSFALVRNFVDATASPENNHATARMHLTREAQTHWTVPPELLIVDDVDTIPAPQPVDQPNVQTVILQADKVGRLKPDQSFVPDSGVYETQVRVERQPDGQWRIANPPPELVASRASFSNSYMQVPIYFLDHDRTGVAPDVRYVVSQPASTLPSRVVELLTMGPSESFRAAMGTAIPKGVYSKTNASEAADGALMVNLSDLRDPSRETRRLIAAQVVLSLQSVSPARVRLMEEGTPMLQDAQELRPTDVASYEADNTTRPDLPGLAVVDERLRVLDQRAQPIPGPAGSGEYDVTRAAQSRDGGQLATVVRKPTGGVGLRVGPYGGHLPETPLAGGDMSRPTWRGSSEVWTVVDGRDLVRVVEENGTWTPRPINAREFSGGRPIGDLRMSRDGTRVAAVVQGQIVVAGVSEEAGQTVLGRPTILTAEPTGGEITGVDWLSDYSLVATTGSNSAPVVEISVDGFKRTQYASANLVQPLTAVTVAHGRRVVVADRSGLWEARDQDDLWGLLQVPIRGGSIPFFPG